jgi:uncharacterized protein YdhG (YjbR/CyaY superfamily)
MVASTAPDVDAWMAEVEPARKPYFERIRQAARRHLSHLTEQMSYGMPTYVKDGQPVFAFNSQKQYISLYVPPPVHALHAEALKGMDAGKSCIRYRRGEQIDFDLLDRLLADTARQDRAC